MLKQTRASDLGALPQARTHQAPPKVAATRSRSRPLVPAFMISELKTAFEIGFLVYVPFLIIDLVISSTLMSMGMMMLPPCPDLVAVQDPVVRAGRRVGRCSRRASLRGFHT